MKIVKITGFPNHVYSEGDGYFIDYAMKSSSVNKSSSILKKYENNKGIYLRYKFFSKVKKSIIDQKHNQTYREKSKYKIEPFIDKKVDYKEVKTNTEIFDRTLGYLDGNELFLELDAKELQDFDNLNLKEFVNLSEDDVLNYVYPLRFNKTSFHRRGGRINFFDIMNKITLSSMGVEKFRGFRGHVLNNSKNAVDENIVLKSYYIKNLTNNLFFEDGVLEGYLYNENVKNVIDQVNVSYDPILKISETSFTLKKINKISTEPRYTDLQQQQIAPYYDFDPKKNDPSIINDSQIYLNKLRDNNLNNILFNNSTTFNRINEDKIFTNNGKTVDLSVSLGQESIIFHESLD